MAAGSGSTLALAARLRALDDATLVRLVSDRDVRRGDIRDFFDLAEALLDRGSVQAALQRLDRPTLAMLAVAAELAETRAATAEQLAERLAIPLAEVRDRIDLAVAAGLLGAESGRYAPWDAVAEQLSAWPAFGLPSRTDLAAPTRPPEIDPADAADPRFVDRGAGDHAFGTVTALTEILVELRDQPARVLARGGLALPDARRLGASAGADPADVESLLEIARLGGLAQQDGSDWVASTEAEPWLTRSRAERWRVLAAGWLHALPDELRELLVRRSAAAWGTGLLDYLGWLYPAGGDWVIERAATASRIAELLGIQSASTTSTAGRALLEQGAETAAAAMARAFPAEVDRVYLQHDLSVIAPGPLRGDLDHRLRGIATTEARGIASSFRFTAMSLHRALLAGESEAGIREFLASLSLTGIPQPLDYLIAEAARRFGSLRVGSTRESGGSYVRSADAGLLGQLAVDQSLAGLGLTRLDEHRLSSRLEVDWVAAVLTNARYAVAVEDEAGQIVPSRTTRRTADGTTVPDDVAGVLVARVRAGAAAPEEDERAWLTRQIELAVKGRLPVQVTVRLPDETVVEYLLEPSGLAGGRLRALDRRADIERTLPMSSIIAVSAPEGSPE
jgi:hypothetical protein